MEASKAQLSLEAWWNEDPEMRYSEIMCGENLRVRVTLDQLSVESEYPLQVGFGEAGTLEAAIDIAIAHAKRTNECQDPTSKPSQN